MSSFAQDVSFGIRSLAKRPAFTALAVGMLAFGIAANTTVFTLFNGAFLRPLPFVEPERLVDLDETAPEWNLDYVGISYPDFHAWEELNSTFESMAVFATESVNVATEGTADRTMVAQVSWQLLRVLQIEPALGRGFNAEDDTEGAEPVVLLTDGMWRERFAADPAVLGTTLRLDSAPFTVVGVLPPEAVFPISVDAWVPLATDALCCDPDEHAGRWWLDGVGRLAEGVSIEQAAADLERVHATLIERLGGSRGVATPTIEPLTERYVGRSRPMLLVMLGAVGLLLVIACANLGGLLLARSTARGPELAIRVALGAGRGRIVRQLLTESCVLAAAGGALGLLAARAATLRVVELIPEQAVGWLRFDMDGRVVGFVLLVSVASALLFGLVPALSTSAVAPNATLQASGRATGTRGRKRMLGGLVIVETALAVVLLVGSVLLVRATQALNDVDPGFRTDVLTYSVSLPTTTYPDHAAQAAFYDGLAERMAGIDGVEAVGLTSHAPLGGHSGYFFAADDTILAEGESPVVLVRFASAEYFEAMGIELVAGRFLDDQDGREARATVERNSADHDPDNNETAYTVAVVNETFARTYWGTTDVLNRVIRLGSASHFTIVGVTRDTKHYGVDQEMRPGVFLPHRFSIQPGMTIAVRADGDPLRYVAAAREVVREADPEVPIFGVTTMTEAIENSVWQRRMSTLLIGIFAAAAFLLSLSGTYGTISYAVGERRREIGIRLALGAGRSRVLRRVVRDGMAPAGIGLLLGIVLAAAAGGAMSTILFGVSPRDPITFLLVVAVLVAATALATVVPAQRAARTDPVSALRPG